MPGPAKGPAKAAGAEGRRGLLVQSGTGLAAAGLGACCGSPACQAAAVAARGERGFLGRTYDRVQAWAMGAMMDKYEVEVAPVKRRLFADLAHSERSLSIVELGIGAGPNLQYYTRPNRADRIVGVDVNAQMFSYAKAKIDALEAEGTGPGPKIDLVIGDAEATGLADASADAVVATLLLCSVADQAKVLSEINRVLKPGGRFYYVEHVIDPNPGVLRTAQNLLTPLQRAVAGGCNLNRDTSRAIARAFPDVREERLSVEFVSLISPHIFGSAAAGHPCRL